MKEANTCSKGTNLQVPDCNVSPLHPSPVDCSVENSSVNKDVVDSNVCNADKNKTYANVTTHNVPIITNKLNSKLMRMAMSLSFLMWN